jgi:hypothetical protein
LVRKGTDLTKQDLQRIGADFTALRREFSEFAVRIFSDKIHQMAAEQRAIAKARNPAAAR